MPSTPPPSIHQAGLGPQHREYVVDVALAARAKTLALFHHDPDRDDNGVDDLLAVAESRVKRIEAHASRGRRRRG